MKTVRTYFEDSEFLDFLIYLMTLETVLDEPSGRNSARIKTAVWFLTQKIN
ncbi:MAG TPA: hypothetical protein VF648_21150 [Pyrinomonadaceae bacterium]